MVLTKDDGSAFDARVALLAILTGERGITNWLPEAIRCHSQPKLANEGGMITEQLGTPMNLPTAA